MAGDFFPSHCCLNKGKFCEEKVAEYLTKKKRLQILYRNYRTKVGEIDLIALDRKKKVIHFVEVKSSNVEDIDLIANKVRFTKLDKYKIGADIFYSSEKKYIDYTAAIDLAIIDVATSTVHFFESITS